MSWRVAKSLLHLRDQVNLKWPKRRTDSDGTIGNAEHATRSSDHNPWVHDSRGQPVVTAMDITHDPASGCDSYSLARALVNSRDRRIKYVISNHQIASGVDGPQPWVWRKYTGKNPHDHHCHISVRSEESLFDDTGSWLAVDAAPVNAPSSSVETYIAPLPTLRSGPARSEMVKILQQCLIAKGFSVSADGYFGSKTKSAVTEFQNSVGLLGDGVVGPETWNYLNK